MIVLDFEPAPPPPPPNGVDFESYKAFGARWVGGAMAACPDDVPWQRVINSQGKISERPGAQIIGGCCRTTPDDIRAIAMWARA